MQLSSGQTRLVGVAQALLGAPELLLLDEPFSGLSFDERRRVSNLLEHPEHTANTRLVIFSTHIPAEAERLAHQIVVLHRGQVLFQGTPQAMIDRTRGCVYEVEVRQSDIPELLHQHRASRVMNQVEGATLRIVGPTVPPTVTAANAHLVTPSLEDAYLLLTSENSHG
jgi:ABC-type multidrug transport system ATPase subunit